MSKRFVQIRANSTTWRSQPKNVVFGFAAGMTSVAFKLDGRLKQRALITGGVALPECGPEWVNFMVFLGPDRRLAARPESLAECPSHRQGAGRDNHCDTQCETNHFQRRKTPDDPRQID
jgi:hypothetical protein